MAAASVTRCKRKFLESAVSLSFSYAPSLNEIRLESVLPGDMADVVLLSSSTSEFRWYGANIHRTCYATREDMEWA